MLSDKINESDIEYWKNRTIELKKAEVQNEIQYVKELQEQYDRALLTVQKQINDWLLKFAKNNGNITLEEAKKLLNSKELKELKWDVNEYIKYGRENGTDLIWEKQLINASSKAHIARLEALEIQIQQQIEKLSNEEQKSTEDFILNQYQDSYYRTAYEIQKGVGVAFNMSSLNLDVINTLINKPWTTDNLTFSDRIWKNKKALIDILQKDLTRSIILGEDNTKIIKKVDDVFRIGKNKAARLVMTESAFFSENARKECFDDLDVKKYILVATLDSRTSEICQELDGKICNEDEFKVGETAPPFHPWCRTTTAPYVERLYKKGFRSARDPETGKTYTISSNLTYKQWKEQYIDNNEAKKKAYDFTRKSAQNHSNDFDQWQRYRNVLGEEVPNSLDKFQELKYNNVSEYSDLKEYYQYKSTYPESNRKFYEINNNIKNLIAEGKVKESIGTAVSPSKEKIEIGSINDHASKRMAERNITKEIAQSYVDNAIVEMSQNNKTLYLSEEGATVLLKEDNRFITTYSKNDFEDGIKSILEVVKNGR